MVNSVEQMMSDFRHGVYDLTDCGRCTGCGECCSNVLPMTDKEIKTIRNYIRVNHIKEQKHTIAIASKCIDMCCPFLDNSKPNKKCTIYSVRPWICKSFKCDQASSGRIFAPRGNYDIVDVRKTFFGGESIFELARKAV